MRAAHVEPVVVAPIAARSERVPDVDEIDASALTRTAPAESDELDDEDYSLDAMLSSHLKAAGDLDDDVAPTTSAAKSSSSAELAAWEAAQVRPISFIYISF